MRLPDQQSDWRSHSCPADLLVQALGAESVDDDPVWEVDLRARLCWDRYFMYSRFNPFLIYKC